VLGAKEGASPASSAFVGDSSRSEHSSAADTGTVTGTESSSGGESSSSQVFPAVSSQTSASNLFGFPPPPTPDLTFPTDPAPFSFKFTPLGKLQTPKPLSAALSLAGAAILGEKLRSPLPVWFLSLFSVATGGRKI
jgi:hypothetical protein